LGLDSESRLPGPPGDDGLRDFHRDREQPARRHHLPGARPAYPLRRGPLMATREGRVDSAIAASPTFTSDVRVRSVWGDAWQRFLRERLSVVGLFVAGSFVILGLIGPVIAPYDYLAQDLAHTSAPPFAMHWLGTDNVGRDILSRILWGYQ